MKFSNLKNIRIATSAIVFALISLLFIDVKGFIPENFYNYILYFQFIPSLLRFFNTYALAATGFIIVMLVTLLFGRVYCASFCPLGIFQDILIFLKNNFYKKNKFSYQKEKIILRYSFLFFAVAGLFSGSVFILSLLDPFSNAGRMLSSIIKPIFIGLNNLLVIILESFNLYYIFPIEYKGLTFTAFIFSLFLIALLISLIFKHGRLFCNSVCPVGTFLGVISKLTLFKIKIDSNNCKACGACEKFCRAECISKENLNIDYSRCINCYDCIDVCPTHGINFENRFINSNSSYLKEANEKVLVSKRNFIASTLTYLLTISNLAWAQNKIQNKKPTTIKNNKNFPVSPPGSKSIAHLKDSCTACNLCVATCPTNVIQPSYLEYGFTGMMMPRMDYLRSFCNYECTKCTEICPTGALLPLKTDNKKLIQLGKAVFIKDNCIVHTENTACGACSEHCPTKAVSMVPFKKIHEPKLNNDICIGCGACEFACPVKPYKAIFVDGNFTHQKAEKPKTEKINEEVDYKEEFPF